jgi:hypothetical protein
MSRTRDPDSIRSQLSRLAIGESYSRAVRLDFDTTTRDGVTDALNAMRNALKSSIHNTAEETGFEFLMEYGEWLTRSRDIVLNVIVTRVVS